MKFIMVMIICFGGDCDAVFDPNSYFSDYNTCYDTALQTTQYMQQTYPESSGEIHCFDQDQMQIFEQWLKDGNSPTLTNPDPEHSGLDA